MMCQDDSCILLIVDYDIICDWAIFSSSAVIHLNMCRLILIVYLIDFDYSRLD